MALSIRNSIIFRNLLNDVKGPSIEDIKNEVIRIFTTEPDIQL